MCKNSMALEVGLGNISKWCLIFGGHFLTPYLVPCPTIGFPANQQSQFCQIQLNWWMWNELAVLEIQQSSIYYAGLLGRWDKWLIDQASDVPSIIFFIISYRLRALKTLYFNFGEVFCKKLWKINNTWSIRRLVDESFVPASHRASILHCRLSDFTCTLCKSPEI